MEARTSDSTLGLLLRLLLGSLFIAHLYWKIAVLPGGVEAWWENLLRAGYPTFVPAYVLSAEIAGALLLIPGVLARYVALYAVPMMIGAAQFWLVRKGFYFTKAGAELPLVWLALLGLQAVAGDGRCALVRSPSPRSVLARLARLRAHEPGLRRVLPALAILCILLGATPAVAQKAYVPPRDADGHPSLEGVWTARWLTSLERPAGTPLALDALAGAARARQILAARAGNDELDPEISDPDAKTLAIVRGQHRASLLVDPPDGRLPLTDAGRAHLAAIPRPGTDGPESRMTNERCLGGPSRPGMLIAPAGMLRQVVQTRDHVLIYSEAFGELRVLAPGAGRQGVGLAPWEGEPTARWEGDALVVESSGFRADDLARAVPFSRFPIRAQTRVTERFTRIGPKELLYEFQVDDPVLYSRSWRAEYSLALTSERIFEFACHEGNYGLANILSGARVEERAAAGR